MTWIWAALGFGLLAALFVSIWGGWGARRARVPNYGNDGVEQGERNLGANINPSQTGNQVNLWPDRTGPQTRRELGAKETRDMTFTGDREEHKGRRRTGNPGNRPSREVQSGPHVNGPTGGPGTGLKPEDEFGENRPAIRGTAPGPNHTPTTEGQNFPPEVRP